VSSPVISHKVLLVAAQSAKLTGVKNRLKMRPFLRVVAVILALCVFLALLQTIDILLRGGMSSLVRSGVLGAATILRWLLILTAGPFGSVQLWRFRRWSVRGYHTGWIFFGLLFRWTSLSSSTQRAVEPYFCIRRFQLGSCRSTSITRSSTLLYVSSIAVDKSPSTGEEMAQGCIITRGR
jgi:hypothetical protein